MAGGKKSGKKSTKPATPQHDSAKSESNESVAETSTMTSEIAKKKAFRTGHRNSTERKLESANELLNSFSDDPSSGSKQRATLALYRSSLKEKLDVIQGLDEEILEFSTEEEIVHEIEETDLFRSHVELVLARLDEALAAIAPQAAQASAHTSKETPPPNETLQSVSHVSSNASPKNLVHDVEPQIKLPKLVLKKFNGDITKWCSFWDSFEAAIHKNSKLAAIDKFNYLNSLLEKTASEAIAGLAITNANYEEAISILETRFGNKQMIINKHMDDLINLAPVNSNQDLRGLRQFYDLVEVHVRGLKALGVPAESYGSLLSSVLMNKVPQEVRLIVSREVKGGDWELDRLLAVMHEELEARERAAQGNSEPPPDAQFRRNKHWKVPPSASSLFSKSDPRPTCTYCKQPHSSNSCGTVSDARARLEILKKAGRCFVCLRKDHLSRECKSSIKCFTCGGRHHVSICERGTKPEPTDKVNSEDQTRPNHPQVTMFISSKTPILLQTAQASISKTGATEKGVKARIILDSGSQRSYITNRLKNELSLPVEYQESMLIKTFGSQDEKLQTCDVVCFSVKLPDGTDMEMSAYSVPLICEPLTGQTVALARNMYKHLNGIHLADYSTGAEPAEVDILIGSDQYWQVVTGELRTGGSGPTALHTRLGWVLSGPIERSTNGSDPSVNLVSSTHVLRCATEPSQPQTDDLAGELKRFWDLESMGISSPEHSVHSQFIDSISFQHGRYEVHLPWRDTHPDLPDNYETSRKRLMSLLYRLRQEPNVFQEYDAVIRDQMKCGIVEEVHEPSSGEVGRVHYLPHHAVIRRDKETTKLRVVYDASCKSNGVSLNDCLHTGPALSQKIMDIILRFRAHRSALAGDIEKAFLNVSIAEEDRDVLRFLWFDDVKKECPAVIVLRFARVVFGVSSSPFLLNATVKHHVERYESEDPEFVETFLRSIYVDDLSSGGDTDEEAYQLYVKSKVRLAEGGFNLRKFVTNSPRLRKQIEDNESRLCNVDCAPTSSEDTYDNGTLQTSLINDKPTVEPVVHEEQSYTKTSLGDTQESGKSEQKILGVKWNFVEDKLVFDLSSVARLASECLPTKRNIAAVAAKFYDPIGFISPVVVQFKLLFQELCENKADWDDTLEGPLRGKWDKLVASLQNSQPLLLERCYFKEHRSEIVCCSLHGFCDASLKAYGAVVYLQICTSSSTNVKFVASKTRVAPLTGQTIPRLELLAAVILARLVTAIFEALKCEVPIKKITCWSDSEVALCWIRGIDKEWKQFVQNRVNEIRKLLPVESWKYCPTDSNPADIPSRGMSSSQLAVNTLWLVGPEWLGCHENELNVTAATEHIPEECFTEMTVKNQGTLRSSTLFVNARGSGIGSVVDVSRFSNLQRLLRVTAYVLRFVKNLKAVLSRQNEELVFDSDIAVKEIEEAEQWWILDVQKYLPLNKKFESWKREFGLFTDPDGILRCGGRLFHADLPYSAKHPILLDANHGFTTLVIRACHERVMHDGVKETLTELRSKFWLVKGRQVVKKLLHSCVTCRRHEGKPYQAPPPPPLPEFRVRAAPAFAFTGLDYAGPLYVKGANKKTETKVWICLYTCCVTRAVHLEIVPDLTPEAFLRSFRRFVARRGLPSRIVSDNASTFTSASKQIAGIMKNPGVKQYLAERGVQWMFNLERAPWWGGLFERMVRSMKRCLKKTIGSARLTYEELLTVVTETEMILNARPLSYVTSVDVEEPLTPSHLLHGRRLMSLPDTCTGDLTDPDFELTLTEASKRMNHLSRVMNHFWRRWRDEYLMELRDAHRHSAKDTVPEPVAVGDIVVVHDEDLPRGLWKLARVEGLVTGADGMIRGATIRVKSKGRKSSTMRRPVQRLYPLEIRGEETDHTGACASPNPSPAVGQPRRNPRRQAAVDAENRRRAWIQELI